MRTPSTRVLADGHEKTLRFYTEVLGFVPETDVSLGEHRRLTVVPPEQSDGAESAVRPRRADRARADADGAP